MRHIYLATAEAITTNTLLDAITRETHAPETTAGGGDGAFVQTKETKEAEKKPM